ncbi:MAG: zf-TFIIB domain-containing protein [Planctomycetota bacterium]
MSKPACPRCQEPLVASRYHGIPVQRCEACAGLRVAMRALRQLAEHLARDLAPTLDLDAAVSAPPDPGGEVRCACGAVMETFGYLNLRGLLLDRCEVCELIWLDGEELPAVAALLARTDARIGRLYEEARRQRQSYVEDEAAVMREARARVGDGGDALSVLLFLLEDDD